MRWQYTPYEGSLLLAAAASVELCRRAMRCWREEAETARTEAVVLADARSWRELVCFLDEVFR